MATVQMFYRQGLTYSESQEDLTSYFILLRQGLTMSVRSKACLWLSPAFICGPPGSQVCGSGKPGVEVVWREGLEAAWPSGHPGRPPSTPELSKAPDNCRLV